MPKNERVTFYTPHYDFSKTDCYVNETEINNVTFLKPEDRRSFSEVVKHFPLWLWFEQTCNPQIYDPDFFVPMNDHKMHPDYTAQNRAVLELTAYRVPQSYMDQTTTHSNEFIAKFNEGDGYYTLLVHPSLRNDKLFLQAGCQISPRKFLFMPAASPRTGLTWEVGYEHQPFFSKMSYRPNEDARTKADLAGDGEAMIAVYKSGIVAKSPTKSKILTDDFSLQFNNSSIIPQIARNGYGVLFRSIPTSLFNDNFIHIPFFALAATPKDNSKPLLVKFIENSGLSIKNYLINYLYPGVINFLLENHTQGIYPEHLHGQNLLIKLGINTHSYADKIKLVGLLPEVAYRDVSDLKVSAEMESRELYNFRKQMNGPDPIFTPGTFLYLGATDFIKRSIYPILIALQNWQANGQLNTSEEINHHDMIMPFFTQLLNALERQMNSTENPHANYYFNTAYEFLTMSTVEQKLTVGTRRERDWLNSLHAIFYYGIQNARVCNRNIDPIRAERLRQHAYEFYTSSKGRYQELDQIGRTPWPMPYSRPQ